MEDYDVFAEMQNMDEKQTIMFVEDDEKFISENLLNSDFECIPVRFTYNLDCFSKEYVELTKKLFTYYFEELNSFDNECLKLKKHFIHFQRNPFACYLPAIDGKYEDLYKMLLKLNVECITDKSIFLKKINNYSKMIFIDNDGTLKNNKSEITDKTKDVIKKMGEIGNYVVICTSRPRYQACEIMKNSNASNYVVSLNGSDIYDMSENKVIFENLINKEMLIKYINYAYDNDLRLVLSSSDYDYVTKDVRNNNQFLLNKENFVDIIDNLRIKQCMFIDDNKEKINEVKKKIEEEQLIKIIDEKSDNLSGDEQWISFSDINTSKGNAMNFFADNLNIPYFRTIAIGNEKNDLSMFEQRGYSIAVENADKILKENADYVTLSNDADGVAHVLELILKKGKENINVRKGL